MERELSHEQILLEHVAELYAMQLAEAEEVGQLLAAHGIGDLPLLRKHRCGYADGTLANTPELREQLEGVGVLDADGNERLADCLVVPIFDENQLLVNLCGLTLPNLQDQMVYLYGENWVWNISAARGAREVVITTSILDGLSVEMAGFANVTCAPTADTLDPCTVAFLHSCDDPRFYLVMFEAEVGPYMKALHPLKTVPCALPKGQTANDLLVDGSLAGFLASCQFDTSDR